MCYKRTCYISWVLTMKMISFKERQTLARQKKPNSILLKIFNEAVTYDGIKEDDIITRKESEDRILNLVILIQLLLALSATILLTQFKSEFSPVIIPSTNLTKPNTGTGPPVQHVALIFQDGSVYDISLNPEISPSAQQVMKLANDDYYFGFSDPLGSLHFISSTISRLITKYNPSIGHSTIDNSIPKRAHKWDVYREGIQVGNIFWVWGFMALSSQKDQFLEHQFNTKTLIYYWKKNIWRDGPAFLSDLRRSWTSTAINSTMAMVVASSVEYGQRMTFVFDFEKYTWINYPPVQPMLDMQPNNVHASLTVLISKHKRM